jgi:hypothetical protein
MQSVFEIMLWTGLFGIAVFAIIPFLINTRFADFLSHAKNPVCQFFGLYGLRRAKRYRILLTLLSRRLHQTTMLAFLFFLVSCAAPAVPTPSTRSAVTSNAAARTNIKKTKDQISKARSQLKDSQIHAASGATHLERAMAGLDQLLKGK